MAALAALAFVVLLALGITGSVTAPDAENGADALPSTPTSPPEPPVNQQPQPSEEPSTSSCDNLEDVTSGQPLCDYEDSSSYDYRLRLAENVDTVLPAVQAIAPWTEQQDLTDLYSTCEDLERGLPAADVTSNAVLRFTGAPDEQVTTQEANTLVDLARTEICV